MGLACVLLLTTIQAPAAAPPGAADSGRVRTVFRVFRGADEVTASTRVRVRQAGTTDEGVVLTTPPLEVLLEPGIYDAQAILQREGRVVGVRWAERLVVMHYPDERGSHLQVINFAPAYGALQLLLPPGTGAPPGALVRLAGPAEAAPQGAVAVVPGPGYLLMVAPAGQYDLRLTLERLPPVDLTGLDVPVGRTRVRVIERE